MVNRRFALFLILTCLLTAGCRDRWRNPYRGPGYARSRGYSACVDSPEYYLPPPESLMRAESRELRNWYEDLGVENQRRMRTRSRVRGRLPRRGGEMGPDFGGYYEDEYYGDFGGCPDCQACGSQGFVMDGMPVELGYGGSFPTAMDGWTTSSGAMPQMMMPSHGQPGHSCPVCGHSGPVQQIDPSQVVPYQGSPQYMAPLQQVPAAPAEPPPTVAPTPPSEDEPMPSPADAPASPVEQIYFAPPLR